MSNNDKHFIKPTKKDCLNLANNLIMHCNLLVPQVHHVSEINSNLIVSLYEKITGSSLLDTSKTGRMEEDDVQAVINALSLDILQLSLSHITGEAVVAGDVVALYNLLHVLEGILLHSAFHGEQTFPKRKISRLKGKEIPDESVCKKISSSMNMEKIFEKNSGLKLEAALIRDNSLIRSASSLVERHRLQHTTKSFKKPTFSYCHKSYLLPRKKQTRRPSVKNIATVKPEYLEHEKKFHRGGVTTRVNFIEELLEEFPCLQISPSLMGSIEKMYENHVVRMHKIIKECLLKRSKASLEAENICKRQLKLAEICKKDITQQQYLKEMKDAKENERKIKYSLRDSRLKSAKMKQYFNDFVEDMREKMLKTNIAEELIFKEVFKEVMDIQSEHVDYLCQQVKEAKTSDDERYLNYLFSLENLYQSQYLALSEEIANERSDVLLRLNAERQALSRTEREFRESLKNEIRLMQEIIVEQTEDCHFRRMDAALYIDKKRKQIF